MKCCWSCVSLGERNGCFSVSYCGEVRDVCFGDVVTVCNKQRQLKWDCSHFDNWLYILCTSEGFRSVSTRWHVRAITSPSVWIVLFSDFMHSDKQTQSFFKKNLQPFPSQFEDYLLISKTKKTCIQNGAVCKATQELCHIQ